MKIYLSFIWISTLLVTMLGTELIFSDDFEDGTLEQYAVNKNLIEIAFYKMREIELHYSNSFTQSFIEILISYIFLDQIF